MRVFNRHFSRGREHHGHALSRRNPGEEGAAPTAGCQGKQCGEEIEISVWKR